MRASKGRAFSPSPAPILRPGGRRLQGNCFFSSPLSRRAGRAPDLPSRPAPTLRFLSAPDPLFNAYARQGVPIMTALSDKPKKDTAVRSARTISKGSCVRSCWVRSTPCGQGCGLSKLESGRLADPTSGSPSRGQESREIWLHCSRKLTSSRRWPSSVDVPRPTPASTSSSPLPANWPRKPRRSFGKPRSMSEATLALNRRHRLDRKLESTATLPEPQAISPKNTSGLLGNRRSGYGGRGASMTSLS